jgi:6-phosphofructokinase 1
MGDDAKRGKSATTTFGILIVRRDCPGLNAAIRGVCRAAYDRYGMTVIGIANGYPRPHRRGRAPLAAEDFSGFSREAAPSSGQSGETLQGARKRNTTRRRHRQG